MLLKFCTIFRHIFSLNPYSNPRYGNPDMQNLGTLKIKLQEAGIFSHDPANAFSTVEAALSMALNPASRTAAGSESVPVWPSAFFRAPSSSVSHVVSAQILRGFTTISWFSAKKKVFQVVPNLRQNKSCILAHAAYAKAELMFWLWREYGCQFFKITVPVIMRW